MSEIENLVRKKLTKGSDSNLTSNIFLILLIFKDFASANPKNEVAEVYATSYKNYISCSAKYFMQILQYIINITVLKYIFNRQSSTFKCFK